MSALTISLDQHAKRIKDLMSKLAGNAIAIGNELTIAWDEIKRATPYGKQKAEWKRWIHDDVGMNSSHARALMSAYKKFGHRKDLPLLASSVFRLLTSRVATTAAIEEIFEHGRKGRVSKKKAKEIIEKHRPSPTEANKQAAETGKAVMASDGYLYLGNTKEEVAEGTVRRTAIYNVRDAIETLASMQVTPRQLLKMAMPHQLWRPGEEAKQIKTAAKWLQELESAWEERNYDAPVVTH